MGTARGNERPIHHNTKGVCLLLEAERPFEVVVVVVVVV